MFEQGLEMSQYLKGLGIGDPCDRKAQERRTNMKF
jgi:hypothetical protein